MGLIKKPSELQVTATLKAMIYGQPGIGKSTLASSAPAPVLLDFDGGVERINGAHQIDTVQIAKWEEVAQAITEIREAGCYQSLVVDTIGKMLALMEDYIKRTQPKMKQNDGTLSLKGYGVRKQMFVQFLNDISVIGMNVIFVAHESETKRGDEYVKRPEISGSAASDLIKELDLVGYMQSVNNTRTICFDPQDAFYAKNTCGMYGNIMLPVLIDKEGNATGENNFFCQVIESYRQRLKANKENTAKYEKLLEEIKAAAAEVKTAEDANNFVEWACSLDHVYNSKAVASREVHKHATAAGLKFNKAKKCYE